MQQTNCRTVQAYFSLLNEDKEARQQFNRLMTVSISRFFRDRQLWRVLEAEILPGLIKEHKSRVKVWSAGCACGEEVYSLRVVWNRLGRRFQPLPELEILASDMNPVYLNRAQNGVYTKSSLREVPEAIRDEYFECMRKGRSYAVTERIKEGIVWEEHNLLVDSLGSDRRAPRRRSAAARKRPRPEGRGRGELSQNGKFPFREDLPGRAGRLHFHLVFLRNSLLTYYGEELEIPAFQRVLDSVTRGGFLIIGSHEKIPAGNWGLVPTGLHPHIYQKKPQATDN